MTDDRMDQATPEWRADNALRVDIEEAAKSEARIEAAREREALLALYEAVGAAPASRETPRQRKVLAAWQDVHALLTRTAPFQEPEEHPE